MTDPISITGSVVGILSLGIQITQALVKYYTSYSGRNSEIDHTLRRLTSLVGLLELLEREINKRGVDERDIVHLIEESIDDCQESIHELQDEYKKFVIPSSGDFKAATRFAGRKMTYPFRQSTHQRLRENIADISDQLSSAMDVLQLQDNRTLSDNVAEVTNLLELVRCDQVSKNLQDWLNAPDAAVNHNAAGLKRNPGSGAWLLNDDRFLKWSRGELHLLWINGFAGSGKSILFFTAVQSLLRRRSSDTSVGVAFFYFSFTDKAKQDENGMLKALLLQLSSQLQNDNTDLQQLYSRYEKTSPPSYILQEYLQRLIGRFEHVYIMLDAVDESPRYEARSDLLDTLVSLKSSNVDHLHILVTSRDEPDIREVLNVHIDQEIPMRNSGIEGDISKSISDRLNSDQKLQKFRWVECQFRSLSACPRSEYYLNSLLDSLPESLDETYERMLSNIATTLRGDARRILSLICFAERPLTVQEVIDAIAVKTAEPHAGLDRSRQLFDFSDIQQICPGFLDIVLEEDQRATYLKTDRPEVPIVRVAHFSVKEYLISDRILKGTVSEFHINSDRAHSEIAKMCVLYVLEPEIQVNPTQDPEPITLAADKAKEAEFPFIGYAAVHWGAHYEYITHADIYLNTLLYNLLYQRQSRYIWARWRGRSLSYDPELSAREEEALKIESQNPIYYIAHLGFEKVSRTLATVQFIDFLPSLIDMPRKHTKLYRLINARSGIFGDALQAASHGGHLGVVEFLLEQNVNIDGQGSEHIIPGELQLIETEQELYACPLSAAATKGNLNVVRLLLAKGANVNAQTQRLGSALHMAAFCGNLGMINILIDHGANVNAQCSVYGSVLTKAYVNEEVVQILIANGAEVQAYQNFVLRKAVQEHDLSVVRLLVKSGANSHQRINPSTRTILEVVAYFGDIEILQVIIESEMSKASNYDSHLRETLLGIYEKALKSTIREKIVYFDWIDAYSSTLFPGELLDIDFSRNWDIRYAPSKSPTEDNHHIQSESQQILSAEEIEDLRTDDSSRAELWSFSAASIRDCYKKVIQLLLEQGANMEKALEEVPDEIVQVLREEGFIPDSGGATEAQDDTDDQVQQTV
ncbi:uncharacterized protein KY384_001669 [Bacidia gigantensis]|uniref:uncharacterized protein n=1 Tax=Bacidia gigantensis TaxID=2732470 RepID=UPI001D057483|nr:uncharacterized protein KY384_001669 [Bacidia gigantensis]KAG8533928.1 hypothetical protein KY384_001669 [Bacidia gigantensis]